MMTDTLTAAMALSDRDLLARIGVLAGTEREAAANLVAHLAALELRPNLYLAQGYGSLFAYCTRALHLSEDAACARIDAARTCRRFPAILDLLAAGSLTLTSVRMLKSHLTAENHDAVLARASNRSKDEVEVLIAELTPRPDVPASVRRLPIGKPVSPASKPVSPASTLGMALSVPLSSPTGAALQGDVAKGEGLGEVQADPVLVLRPPPRPTIQPLAPERYRVQFTIGRQAHDKLRRLQALLRREIPDGDPGALFERMVDMYLEKVEIEKLGATKTGPRTYESRIRSRTDTGQKVASRHIPNAVKRVVWRRDDAQCAFVSGDGRRCGERSFLELHHIQPFALNGPATASNIALRCRRHNQYEAEMVFGPRSVTTPG